MSATDARRELAEHAMKAASQRDRLLVEILSMDIDSMMPLDALTKLYELRRLARQITAGSVTTNDALPQEEA